jgi:hypothetical protein
LTIKEAVKACLDEWYASHDFNLTNMQGHIEELCEDGVTEWALEHNYEFDDEIAEWVKKP